MVTKHVYRFHGNDFKIIADAGIEQEMYLRYEVDLRDKYWNIEKGDVVVDVGSGWGEFAVTAMACGASHVFAIEPREERCTRIRAQMKYNDYPEDRYTIINRGLYNKVGATLSWSSSHSSSYYEKQDSTIENLSTLDEELRPFDLKRLDWIKYDTDGGEMQILEGSIETLKKFKPNILMEAHTFIEKDVDKKIIKFLKKINRRYVVTEIGQYHMYPMPNVHILFKRPVKNVANS